MTYLSAEEVSARLPLCAVSIRRACQRGDFPGAVKRMGRWMIPAQSVDAWLTERPDPGVMAPGTLSPDRAQLDQFHRAITGGNA